MRDQVERYKVPADINHLLYKWGRANNNPRLGYPDKSIPCCDYREQGYKEERPPYSREDYEKLCELIDKPARPEQRVLEIHYRYRISAFAAAKEFQVSKEQFLGYQDKVREKVVRLMGAEGEHKKTHFVGKKTCCFM